MTKYLTTADVQRITGWSRGKILGAIHSGRLPAVNTSLGTGRATFSIRAQDLEALLSPDPAPRTTSRRGATRVDAGVARVFG